MNKKITINTKPSQDQHQKIIDSWVSGKKAIYPYHAAQEKEVRFTVVLPENLYSNLKIKAAKERKKLKEIIKSIIEKAIQA